MPSKHTGHLDSFNDHSYDHHWVFGCSIYIIYLHSLSPRGYFLLLFAICATPCVNPWRASCGPLKMSRVFLFENPFSPFVFHLYSGAAIVTHAQALRYVHSTSELHKFFIAFSAILPEPWCPIKIGHFPRRLASYSDHTARQVGLYSVSLPQYCPHFYILLISD